MYIYWQQSCWVAKKSSAKTQKKHINFLIKNPLIIIIEAGGAYSYLKAFGLFPPPFHLIHLFERLCYGCAGDTTPKFQIFMSNTIWNDFFCIVFWFLRYSTSILKDICFAVCCWRICYEVMPSLNPKKKGDVWSVIRGQDEARKSGQEISHWIAGVS